MRVAFLSMLYVRLVVMLQLVIQLKMKLPASLTLSTRHKVVLDLPELEDGEF